MKNNGKLLERAIELIQWTLSNIPDTKVYRNYIIKTPEKNRREFDVFISSRVNGFDINIAIECKDYLRKISVEKIEAFNSKCSMVSGIHKKVFVTTTGFQPAAMEAAKSFDIELYLAPQLTNDQVRNWLGLEIKKLGFKVHLPFKNIVFYLETEDAEYLSRTNEKFDGKLYWKGNKDKPLHIHQILKQEFDANSKLMFKYGMLEWMRRNSTSDQFPLPFELHFNDVSIIGFDGTPIKLNGVSAEIDVEFPTEDAQIIDAREFSEHEGAHKANSISFELNKRSIGSIISQNGSSDFYYSNQKVTIKLKTLLLYDPKTDQFSLPED